jgi:hypothetical protein
MNKSTRTFIYGFFLLFFFGIGAAISVDDIIKASYSLSWDYLFLSFQLVLMGIGYDKIQKVIH